MATLTLQRLWINLVATGEGISAASNRGKEYTADVDLAVRTYANGRRRAISTAGVRRGFGYTLVAVNTATKAKLETWIGLTVQVRDVRGQKRFGVFGGITVTEYLPADLYTVAFTLLETTLTEGV